MRASERALIWTLRGCGALMLLAIPAVFLPVRTMAAIHEWLGLGAFPEAPIVDYLARTESAIYAIFGGLLWIVAGDLERHERILRYLIWTGFAFGFVALWIDRQAGLPASWAWTEGPMILVLSGVFLVLWWAWRRPSSRDAA